MILTANCQLTRKTQLNLSLCSLARTYMGGRLCSVRSLLRRLVGPPSPRPLRSISVLHVCRRSSARKAEWERPRSCGASTSSFLPRSEYFISSKPKLVSIFNFCSSVSDVVTRPHDSMNVRSRSPKVSATSVQKRIEIKEDVE